MERIYLEVGPKKVFACSLDWPGWCRIGKSEDLAVENLLSYAPRYRVVAARAGLDFTPDEPKILERVPGNATTDFGAPEAVPEADQAPVSAEVSARDVALMRAAWAVFDEVAAESPAELRKGPRGGGRDRDKMIAHVLEAERSYARTIGVRHRPFLADQAAAFAAVRDGNAALGALRDEIAETLGQPSDGSPLIPRGWPARYAARRIAWHVIDHLWEMEDRRV